MIEEMRENSASYFDSHVHLDLLSERPDFDELLQEARRVGVEQCLVPGVSPEGWPALVRLCERLPGAWAAPGLHPLAAHLWSAETERRLAGLLANPSVAAVGEIGLDRALPGADFAVQERAFVGQLRLALEAGLPVVIHCRRAASRLMEILRREDAGRVGGILHAFGGSLEVARQAVDLGFAIGLGGTLTYPDARKAPQLARELDEHWLVLETDAPDMPPFPHRGESNRPAWLTLVAQALARERGWDLATTARITAANARRVLGLS